MKSLPKTVITRAELDKLESAEDEEAHRRGVPEFKFGTNEEMLEAVGLGVRYTVGLHGGV
jgi:hypothetical protein